MITGYKKQKLGKPSEKLSGDVPRAKWRAVLVSEILFPIVMAVVLTIAYMFVKSVPDKENNQQPAAPLLRILIVALGPLVWNMAVLAIQFLISLMLGPMLGASFPKFGSVMASIVHVLGTVGMIVFFEFLVGDPSHCL
jgi:1,3-beta-glucan synthase